MVSKEQERKAFEQIKKIVEGLGKDSYIAMAFDGYFGCSMMQSLRDAERKIAEREEELAQTRKDLEVSRRCAESYKEAWEEAVQKNLGTIDLNACLKLAESRATEAREKMIESAYKIADNEDNPTSDEFALALKTYSESKADFEYFDGLVKRINAAKA